MFFVEEILKKSAVQIAKLVKQKRISPTEVVDAHIGHIQKINPKINAVTEFLFDSAKKEAKAQTEQLGRLSPESLPELFGVPFSVKEMLAVSGAKRTGGNIHHKNAVMAEDASVVKTLRAAGAIPLCTTNVPELGFWFESYNPIYGRTNNPYDLSRTPGGSTGGEGALVGAGGTPFGLGSDIGGSIRIPAFFCGVFGHKPSNRTVPLTGHFPYSVDDIKKLVGSKYPWTSVGFLTRKSEDLPLLMKLLSKPDGIDSEMQNQFQLSDYIPHISKLKIHICVDPKIHLTKRASDEVQQSLLQVADFFKTQGCQVRELNPKIFSSALNLWLQALKSTKDLSFEQALSPFERVDLSREFFLHAARKNPNYSIPVLITVMLERLQIHSDKKSDQTAEELKKLRETIENILDPHSILLFPTHPRVAPKHYHVIASPFDFVYAGIFNVLGFPATNIPLGLNKDGIPLGLQVISGHNQDHLNFFMAKILEEAFGGWIPPNP